MLWSSEWVSEWHIARWHFCDSITSTACMHSITVHSEYVRERIMEAMRWFDLFGTFLVNGDDGDGDLCLAMPCREQTNQFSIFFHKIKKQNHTFGELWFDNDSFALNNIIVDNNHPHRGIRARNERLPKPKWQGRQREIKASNLLFLGAFEYHHLSIWTMVCFKRECAFPPTYHKLRWTEMPVSQYTKSGVVDKESDNDWMRSSSGLGARVEYQPFWLHCFSSDSSTQSVSPLHTP